MNKFIVATLSLLITNSVIADNISMMMNGIEKVKIVNVIEGTELHSFSVDRVDLLPAPCSANRIVFDAGLPLANVALGILLDAEYGDIEMEELEYNYGADEQCHLVRFEQRDPPPAWSIENLLPLDSIWMDSDGSPKLVAIGCPDPWDRHLYYDFMQFGATSGDTMRPLSPESGDMCVSTRSEFLNHTNWNFDAYWRVCSGDQCTPYVKINTHP